MPRSSRILSTPSAIRMSRRDLLPRAGRCGAGPVVPPQALRLAGSARQSIPSPHPALADDQLQAATVDRFIRHFIPRSHRCFSGLIVSDDQRPVTRSIGGLVRGGVYA
ncbi:hypothetical protein [uncultured Cohaesibacter sp.]|uniref:hypothetical protein n=1 Tax=uncultured Cohaesibacter sp. TaxID=1002546 RepID=UPI0029C728C6|nr:hypothetical protein [uncultured Cohaesibacter sp.]